MNSVDVDFWSPKPDKFWSIIELDDFVKILTGNPHQIDGVKTHGFPVVFPNKPIHWLKNQHQQIPGFFLSSNIPVSRRVGHRGVYSNAVHPGVVASEPWAMAGDQEKWGDLIRKKIGILPWKKGILPWKIVILSRNMGIEVFNMVVLRWFSYWTWKLKIWIIDNKHTYGCFFPTGPLMGSDWFWFVDIWITHTNFLLSMSVDILSNGILNR